MKRGLTELVCILDKSGSMAAIIEDAIGSYNTFISQQQAEPGECRLTLVQFDHQYNLICEAVDIAVAAEMDSSNYVPGGTTALLDAVGKTINNIGHRLANTTEEARPEKVIFFIMTDGMENSSREFSYNQIKEMIKHQQEHYSWSFMFASSDLSGAGEAMNIGIPQANYMQFNKSGKGQQTAYNRVSDSVSMLRSVRYEDYLKVKDQVFKKHIKKGEE